MIDFEGFQLWDQRNQTLAYFDFPIKQDFDFYTRVWSEKKYVIFHYFKYIKTNSLYKSLLILALIIGLFATNVFQIALDSRLVLLLDILIGFCLLAGTLNLVISLIGSLEYFNSFYFYVEIVSLVIYIFEFPFVKDMFYKQTPTTSFLITNRIYLFLEILKLVRVNLLLKEIFSPFYLTKADYYQRGLLMPEYYIKRVIQKETDTQSKTSFKRMSTFSS